jgi:cytidylate kinase
VTEVITIDGPSGSGKGTISKLLAKKLGYSYLDTGALYRAVAWKAREEKVATDDDKALEEITAHIKIEFKNEKIFADGIDISSEIRTAEIGEMSSQVSARPVVRAGLFSIQRDICLKGKVVIEGRDAGTTIFPESSNKFFLDASVEERARRRYEELKLKDPDVTLETTTEDIKKRDLRDSSRETSPLQRSDDMVHIDSTHMTIEEVVNKIAGSLKHP